MRIEINTRAEYDYARSRGYEPLIDSRFEMRHALRVAIQNENWPGHSPASNERFFRWIWKNTMHRCEECMKPLDEYSAVYCSHILSRGSNPEMAHDPRNMNILCFDCHNRWEQSTTRKGMRIEPRNNRTIEKLKFEYNIKSKDDD